MVVTPEVAIVTVPPPPVASDVAPLESNVETEVSPVTSSVVSKVTASSTLRRP